VILKQPTLKVRIHAEAHMN